MQNNEHSSTDLTSQQALRAAALGLALWLTGAILIRFLRDSGIFGSTATGAATFAASFPLSAVLVWMVRTGAGLTRAQSLTGVAVASFAAAMADGVFLNWFPELYGGNEAATLLAAAAWLLWVFGSGLAIAFIQSRQPGATTGRPSPSE